MIHTASRRNRRGRRMTLAIAATALLSLSASAVRAADLSIAASPLGALTVLSTGNLLWGDSPSRTATSAKSISAQNLLWGETPSAVMPREIAPEAPVLFWGDLLFFGDALLSAHNLLWGDDARVTSSPAVQRQNLLWGERPTATTPSTPTLRASGLRWGE